MAGLRVMIGVALVALASGTVAWLNDTGFENGLIGEWVLLHEGCLMDVVFSSDGTGRIGIGHHRYTVDETQQPATIDIVTADGVRLQGVFEASPDRMSVDLAYRPEGEPRPTDPTSRGMRLLKDRDAARSLARETQRQRDLFARVNAW